MTRRYRFKLRILALMSFLLNILPVMIYVCIALCNNEAKKVNKITLGLMLSVALILTLINMIAKLSLRCIPWIILLGIYVCLSNITTLLIIISICTIIDEIIIDPLYKSVQNKYRINKELDKRIAPNG